jgi:hypothetical protein
MLRQSRWANAARVAEHDFGTIHASGNTIISEAFLYSLSGIEPLPPVNFPVIQVVGWVSAQRATQQDQ